MYVLGINAYHGDAAAALIEDGRVVAAVEEERFNRIKHCAGFPAESVKYCLQAAGVGIQELEHIGISRDPSAHLHKKVLFAARRFSHRSTETQRKQIAAKAIATATVGMENADETSALLAGRSAALPAGNGNGRGVFRQIRDRLKNAAMVRDLPAELSRALGISRS